MHDIKASRFIDCVPRLYFIFTYRRALRPQYQELNRDDRMLD